VLEQPREKRRKTVRPATVRHSIYCGRLRIYPVNRLRNGTLGVPVKEPEEISCGRTCERKYGSGRKISQKTIAGVGTRKDRPRTQRGSPVNVSQKPLGQERKKRTPPARREKGASGRPGG